MSVSEKLHIMPGDDIEMDLDNLETRTNISDDRKSVKSISKSIKRSIAESGTTIHLKKKDKRALRKNLFIKKIDSVHQILNKSKKSKNGSGNIKLQPNLEELPQENMLFFKSDFKQPKRPQPVCVTRKGIAKAKHRKQEMLSNINTFKEIVANKKSIHKLAEDVRRITEQKLLNEEI